MSSETRKSKPSIRSKFAFIFGVMFLISTLVPLTLTLYFTFESLKDSNRSEIEDKAAELVGEYELGGLNEIKKTIEIDNTLTFDRPFYVRISAKEDNTTLFSSMPKKWTNFDFRGLTRSTIKDDDEFFMLRDDDLDYALEILTVDLSDRYILQVGSSTKMREHVVSSSIHVFLLVIIPSLILVLLAVWYISSSMLKPVSQILGVVREVIDTDSYRQKIPNTSNSKEFDEMIELTNTMFSRLDSLINNLRETLETVAHDIRTPMTRIRTRAEVAISRAHDPDEMNRTLRSIIQESDTVGSLLRLILDASEAESGLVEIEEKETDLVGLCSDAAEVYEYIALDKNITVSFDAPSPLVLYIDPSRIQQAIGNLLDNAVKHSPEHSTVSLILKQHNSGIHLSVQDEGGGIDEENAEDLWKPRFRSPKTESGGYGLGLAIVKAVIHAHGGTVGARNRPNGGAEFYFTLTESRLVTS